MYACEYTFFLKKGITKENFLQDFWSFIGALHKSGQTVNEDTIIQSRSPVRYICICPEEDSLNPRHHTLYAKRAYRKLLDSSSRKPQFRVLGEIVETSRACRCKNRAFLVFFTRWLDHSSPVVCGKCGQPVPLYRLPRLEHGDYSGYLAWQETYRDCDSLFMLSGVGESFGYKQLSELKSELTKLGRELRALLQKKTGVPVFYYLHRYYGISQKAEAKRRCPGCGYMWKKQESDFFCLRCDRCQLISTVAQDFRKY